MGNGSRAWLGMAFAAVLVSGCARGKGTHAPGKLSAEEGHNEAVRAAALGQPRSAEAEPEAAAQGMVPVELVGVAADPQGDGSVVAVLQEQDGERRVLPIFIGMNEGIAIQMRLDGQRAERPLTHDLLESILEAKRLRVTKVEVRDLQEGTFIGNLYVTDQQGAVSVIDARPSDCIALAVGAGAPIFVARKVLDEAGQSPAALGLEPAPTSM